MQTRVYWRLAFVLIGALIVSACGGRTLGTSWPNMSAADGTLYIADGVAVYAVDGETGTQQWQFPAEADRDATQFYNLPTILPDLIVVSSFHQTAYALNPQGVPQWQFDSEPLRTTTAPSATSAAGQHVLLVAGNTLHALNAETGEEAWQFTAGEALWAPPASDGEVLYQPGMDHKLYALDLENGSEQWQQEFEGALASTPTLVDGTLYLGSLSSNVYALDAASGRVKWKLGTDNWVWSSPVVSDGTAYFGDLQNSVYAVDAETGEVVWQAEVDSAVRAAPALAGGSVFVNTEGGFVYSLDSATGAVNWQVEIDPETGERLLANPILVDDLVLIVALNGTQLVYAYNQETGSLAWQYNPDR